MRRSINLPPRVLSTCSSSSCSSVISSIRSSKTNSRRNNARSIALEFSPVNLRFLSRRRDKVVGYELRTERQRNCSSCCVKAVERIDLEAEIYDFMMKSGNPRDFPSREDLIIAGRMDLVEAIACHGGWLAYGWDVDDDDGEERSEEIVGDKISNDGLFSNSQFDVNLVTAEDHGLSMSSYDGIFDGRSIDHEDESGIDGILKRLEKERILSIADINHRISSEGYDSKISVKGKNVNGKANGVKQFLYGIHRTEQDSSSELRQNHLKSRLLLLESELFSVMSSIRSQKDTISPLEGKGRSQKEAHKLADAQEFVETEIMNVQDKLRSIKAQNEQQKIIDEKQRRINATRKTLNYLRTAYVAWPNLASEVFVAGSFDGWTSQRRMERSSMGIFSLNLKLYPGQYEIKFIIDGVWKVDPLRPIVHHQGFENNLLTVL